MISACLPAGLTAQDTDLPLSLRVSDRKGANQRTSDRPSMPNCQALIFRIKTQVTIVPKDETAKADRDLPKALNRAIFDKWRELYAHDLPGLQMCAYDGGKAAYAVGGEGQADVSARDSRTWLVDLPRESGRERAFDVTLAQKTELKIENLMAALHNRADWAEFPQHTLQVKDQVHVAGIPYASHPILIRSCLCRLVLLRKCIKRTSAQQFASSFC